MAFLVIEQREPHAGRMAFTTIEQPETFEARRALAVRIRDELEIPLPILIDGMDDASRAVFGDLPSPAFVIGRDGSIVDKLPWADPEAIAATLERVGGAGVLPEDPAGPWPLVQRAVFARQLVWAGRHDAALAWLDTTPEPAPCVPPTFAACAYAAIARAHALRGADPEAIAAAQDAIGEAWPASAARRVAALTELAELVPSPAQAAPLWAAAAAALEPRAPDAVRAFLVDRAAATQKK